MTTVAPATYDELLRCHSREYVDFVLALAGRTASLDDETHLSAHSVDAARLAAGASVRVVSELLGGSTDRVFAAVRPPGHHAGRGAAMGYCIFNNVAIAALTAMEMGARRVLVVDLDVHHGNGSEEILRGVPGVLLVSVHQDGLFPKDCGAQSLPSRLGDGGVLNLPLPPLSTDADYRAIVDAVVLPAATVFAPELVLVSAGFDAHWRDEQGGMRMSTPGLIALMASLIEVAGRARWGIGYILEGGYDLEALEACVEGTLAALGGALAPWPTLDDTQPEVLRRIEAIRRELRPMLDLGSNKLESGHS